MAKVIVSPVPVKITRERRKLKAYRRNLDRGRMTEEEIRNAYMSWRQSIMKSCSCFRSVENMDKLYVELFGKSPLNKRSKGKKTRYSYPDAPGVKHFIQLKGGIKNALL